MQVIDQINKLNEELHDLIRREEYLRKQISGLTDLIKDKKVRMELQKNLDL